MFSEVDQRLSESPSELAKAGRVPGPCPRRFGVCWLSGAQEPTLLLAPPPNSDSGHTPRNPGLESRLISVDIRTSNLVFSLTGWMLSGMVSLHLSLVSVNNETALSFRFLSTYTLKAIMDPGDKLHGSIDWSTFYTLSR